MKDVQFKELLESTEMKKFELLVTYLDCISIYIADDKVPSLYIHENISYFFENRLG